MSRGSGGTDASFPGGDVAKKAQGPTDKGGTLGEIAESLGTLLGNAERQWRAWQGPRDAVLKAVTDVRDRASALLAEMGTDVKKGYDTSKGGKKDKKARKKAKAEKAEKAGKGDKKSKKGKKAGKKKGGKKAGAPVDAPADPLES
jgi:hypothetical protein